MVVRNLALAVVAAHGASDVFERPVLTLAAHALSQLLPASFLAPAFVVSGLVHFGRDVGMRASIAMHAAWATAEFYGSGWVAWQSALAFSTFVHVPRHFARLRQRDCPEAVWSANAAFAALLYILIARGLELVPPPPLAQRMVVGHVCVQEYIQHSL